MARVLAIDDQEEILILLARMLTMAGHVVTTAPNGQEGLQRAREQHPEVIVTDLMMPLMSGHDLIRELRADPATAGIPVIVLSAYADDAIEGADAVIRKPFVQADLLALVEQMATR